jgi:hypothetical protein
MAKLHEKLGISEEQLQELMKNPQNFDPQLRQRIMKTVRFSALKTAAGVAAAIVLFGGGLFFGINYLTGTLIEQTAELPGNPAAFDPIKSLPAVQAHATTGKGAGNAGEAGTGPTAELLSIDAKYVKADGTLDLTVTDPYRPRADYQFFIRDDANGKEAPPLGAGGVEGGFYHKTVSVDVYEPGQWRHVRSMGSGGSSEYSYQNKGMDRDEGSLRFDNPRPAPLPSCTFATLWQKAIELGAPANALADINYSLTYQGDPRYQFSISGSDYDFTFGADCRLIE